MKQQIMSVIVGSLVFFSGAALAVGPLTMSGTVNPATCDLSIGPDTEVALPSASTRDFNGGREVPGDVFELSGSSGCTDIDFVLESALPAGIDYFGLSDRPGNHLGLAIVKDIARVKPGEPLTLPRGQTLTFRPSLIRHTEGALESGSFDVIVRAEVAIP
ncbi:fimbrial protein [Pseudomonas fontis]|uniref:Fimbrial protein n=1 Tax=Pseudomonas fontis TaxID=2942633 RepID=A0ABT5NQ47_9PSED|nr:hypothetical protein [Pseudomonas fontis]MDD0972839.1 hypothetical protein [Pseudomonas fontis]MDD0990296.1 hypothetical protein [Pseudomonas fontis]